MVVERGRGGNNDYINHPRMMIINILEKMLNHFEEAASTAAVRNGPRFQRHSGDIQRYIDRHN